MDTLSRDFFISYQNEDRSWAQWIAWVLEENGFSVYLQAWDFRPGGDFVLEMHRNIASSERIIAILSESYLAKAFPQPEWASAFVNDPEGKEGKLLPIRITKCKLTGLLKSRIYIDLCDLDEKTAEGELLNGVCKGRSKPKTKPDFPGSHEKGYTPYFPNTPPSQIFEKYSQLLEDEFTLLLDRFNEPNEFSQTSLLLYGERFPHGIDEPIPEISHYSLFLDIKKLLDATVGKYQSHRYQGVKEFKPHILYKIATCRWRIFVSAIADKLTYFDKNILLQPIFDALHSNKVIPDINEKILNQARSYIHIGSEDNTDFSTTTKLLGLLASVARNTSLTIEDLLNEEQQKYRTHSAGRNNNASNKLKKYKIKMFFSDAEGTYEIILKALADRHVNIVISRSWSLLSREVATSEILVTYDGSMTLKEELDALCNCDSLCDIFFKYSIAVQIE